VPLTIQWHLVGFSSLRIFLIIFNISEEIKFIVSKNIYLMLYMNKKGVGQEEKEKNIRRNLPDF
jgi:hypothetical protein